MRPATIATEPAATRPAPLAVTGTEPVAEAVAAGREPVPAATEEVFRVTVPMAPPPLPGVVELPTG